MVVCEEGFVSGCAGWTVFLAWIGGIALYLLVALIFSLIACGAYYKRRFGDLTSNEQSSVVILSILWPITLIGLVGYWIVSLIILPFVAAKKNDLVRLENNLTRKISEIAVIRSTPARVDVEFSAPIRKFRVGDLITGIPGNPDGYKHLYEGCVCRVLSINDKGIMTLLLVDHKDKEAQKAYIGQTFTAPSRNFVLLGKPKRTRSRRSRRR
jgi:hypothetical protein